MGSRLVVHADDYEDFWAGMVPAQVLWWVQTMKTTVEDLKDLTFIHLHSAVLCGNCEMISNETHKGRCCACGSKAVMSLPRLLGGTVLPLPEGELLTAEFDDDVSLDDIEAVLKSVSQN